MKKIILIGTIIFLLVPNLSWSQKPQQKSQKDAIFVDTEGNVGIGTTSPSSKLHVIGL